MGSEYKLPNANLAIYEISNILNLYVEESDDVVKLTEDLKPEDLMKTFLEGLTVCSYWMDEEDFKRALKEWMYNNMIV